MALPNALGFGRRWAQRSDGKRGVPLQLVTGMSNSLRVLALWCGSKSSYLELCFSSAADLC